MKKTIILVMMILALLSVSCQLGLKDGPSSSFAAGDIPCGTGVVLSTSIKNAVVHYTDDGTDPTPQSTIYQSPIVISEPTVLKAVAVKEGEIVSEVATYSYRTYTPGQAGGYLFYDKGFYSDGWRYLEAAPADITVGSTNTFPFGYYRTSSDGTNIFVNGSSYDKGSSDPNDGKSTGTSIGTGKANTAKLVSTRGNSVYTKIAGSETTSNYAAKLCDDYTYGGYSDWFLPSKDELNLMFINLYGEGIGGLAYGYWSSSEYYYGPSDEDSNGTNAWAQGFYGTIEYDTRFPKILLACNRVRAIRAY